MYEERWYLEIDTTIPGWAKTLLSLQKTFAGNEMLYSGELLTTSDGRLTWATMTGADAVSLKIAAAIAPYVVNKLSYKNMQIRNNELIAAKRFKDPISHK